MRILHILLHCSHFLAIYVDDLLGLFPKQSAPLSACICVLLAKGLGIPLSWHKLQLCDSLTWIGWRLSFASDPVATLPDDKRRLLNLLKPLTKAGARIGRKELRKNHWLTVLVHSRCTLAEAFLVPVVFIVC